MTLSSFDLEPCLQALGNDPRPLSMARRRARLSLAALWLFAMPLFAIVSPEAALAVAILLIGVSILLESAHGALAFDRFCDARRPQRRDTV